MRQLPNTVNGLIVLIQILAGVTLLLIGIMYFLEYTKPSQRYFASSNTATASTTKEIFPLTEPNISTNTLLRWAALAATNAYTLDFVNYEDSLEKLKPFFTKAGFNNFRLALDATNRLQDIIDKKLIVSAVVYAQPLLITEGNLNGFYSWRIRVPILLSYQGASETSTKQNIAVTMLVTRVPTTDAPTGIGITQMQDREYFP